MLAVAVALSAVIGPAAWFASAAPGALGEASISTPTRPGHLGKLMTITVHGRDRHYRVFVPSHSRPGPRPLLVVLHPLNSSSVRFERTAGLDSGADAHDVVLVYPDGLGHSWDAGTCCGYAVRHHVADVDFILRVVRDVQRRLTIDPHRIAVTGFSNGALMSYRLVCERADVFDAAVAVAGDVVAPQCRPVRPVALLHVHGVRDPLIPLAGNVSSDLDPSGFPAAAASVGRIATADGCSGSGATTSPGLVVWTATGCAGTTPVEFVTVEQLGHHYPSGTADARRYAVNMDDLTWQFLGSLWSR